MLFDFKNKKISSIITVLPKEESYFDDELKNYNFPQKKSLMLKEVMGYNKHRIAPDNVMASDLVYAGFKKMFEDNVVKPEEIDAFVYITQSHDYIMPQTSTILQHRLNLSKDILCFDITQGCAGFVHGLFQAFMLLDNPSIKKVAIANTDVLARKANKKDRNSYPLSGDAASVTIVEKSDKQNLIHCFNETYGEGAFVLHIPAGGFKMPCNEFTKIEKVQEDGNIRSLENLVMEGASVFSFVQEHVPRMVDILLNKAKLKREDIDYYIFHQPNKFMLQKLADKIEVPYEKMPNNIVENFGNSSGATIPVNICYNLKNIITKQDLKILFAGFGIGLTLAGVVMDVEKLEYCNLIEI